MQPTVIVDGNEQWGNVNQNATKEEEDGYRQDIEDGEPEPEGKAENDAKMGELGVAVDFVGTNTHELQAEIQEAPQAEVA